MWNKCETYKLIIILKCSVMSNKTMSILTWLNIDMFHKEVEPKQIIPNGAGWSQSAVSKLINGKLSRHVVQKGAESNRDNSILQKIKRVFCSHKIHKVWTTAGVRVLRANTHTYTQETGCSCQVVSNQSWTTGMVKILLPGWGEKVLNWYSVV